MATVTIVTDRMNGEPDILEGIEHQALRIEVDGREVARSAAPESGWSDHSLRAAAEGLCRPIASGNVIDAFLGASWVGSSEV